jgi:hypothetical protein
MDDMSELRINKILGSLKQGTKLSEEILLIFFLGEYNEYISNIQRNKLKNRKLSLTELRRKNLLESSDWGKERFLRILQLQKKDFGCEKPYEILLKNAREVYKEYAGKEFKGNVDAEIFRQIAMLMWFGTLDATTIFARQRLSDEKYIKWSEKETELEIAIENRSILFVSGSAAIGKTRLVENFINNKVFGECVFTTVVCGGQIPQIQVEYQYDGIKRISLQNFLEQCKWKDSKEYLIINWDYFKEEEIAPLLQWGSKHAVKIIVITRMKTIPKEYKTILIKQCTDEVLRKLVERNVNAEMSDDYKEFFELLCYNPFLVDVFSIYLGQGKETIQSFFYNAVREGEAEQLALSKGSKVRCLYRAENGNDLLSLSTILSRSLLTCSNEDIRLLCDLIVWIRTPIDKEFVIKMGGFKEETIDALIDKNYLTYTEENKIQMYPVFVWAIAALEVELCTINSDETSTQIKAKFGEQEILYDENGVKSGMNLLNSMKGNSKCPTTHIEYFYQVIQNIICRYQRLYSANINLSNDDKKKYYDQWTQFLEQSVILIREMGNRDLAEWIQEKIYIIYKKKKEEYKATIEQERKKKWEQFILNIMQGTIKEEEWDDMIDMARDGVSYHKVHFLIDMFIYMEIYDIAYNFIDYPNDKYIMSKRRGMIGVIDKYLGVLNNYGVNDDMEYLYIIVKYYLLALGNDRCYLQEARSSLSRFVILSNNDTNEENIFRIQIYNLFFELLIYWKDNHANPQEICNVFGFRVESLFHNLKVKSYSIWTTNSAIVCLFIAFALVPIRLLRNDWMNYICELKSGKFDLFQKLADVNKYQYQISDNHYNELEETIKTASEGISAVYEKYYKFKKNE